jgi:hypothetical protein
MAHTMEQRSQHLLCGARKKDGELCRKFAGEATPHPGIGHCKYHGGSTPSHIKKAALQEAKERLIEFGQTADIDPASALLMCVRISAGQVQFIKSALEQGDASGYDRQVLLSMWDSERDRLVGSAKSAHEAGVAEYQIRMAESYGAQLAHTLRAVFDDLGLDAEQQARLPEVLGAHLINLERRADLLEPALIVDLRRPPPASL